MNSYENVINTCAYFFEVLISKFLEIERAFNKESGLLSLFKKINYMDRTNAFNGLLECSIEAKNALQLCDSIMNNSSIRILVDKLTECLNIYINMVSVQIKINTNLNRKAKGEQYNWNEYKKSLKCFNMFRSELATELPKLQSLYENVLRLA